MAYFTFGVKGLGPSLRELQSVLQDKKVTVGKTLISVLLVLKELVAGDVFQAIQELSANVEKQLAAMEEEEEDESKESSKKEPEVPQVFTFLIERYE